MSKNLASIGAVSAATVVSRLLGLARDMLTAAVFGTTALASAYVTAFTLPNLFRRLLGEGALTAALIPTLSDEMEDGGRDGAFALVNKVASWLVVVTVVLVLVLVGAMVAVRAIPGLEERWYLGAFLAQILFPYMTVICLAAAFGAALNLLGEYTIPALTAVWLNTSILLGLGIGGWFLAETAMDRMYWLCGSILVGGFLQCCIPAHALWRRGWRPQFDLQATDRFRAMLGLMVPGLFGAAIFQINILVSRGLAFALDESAATLLYLANRLIEVPLGVFTISISTVTFPAISRLVAQGDIDEMGRRFQSAIMLTMHVALPASVGLFVLAKPIVQLLFERGAFGNADTEAMVPVLAIFCAGLPFYSYATLVTRAFHSMKDMKTPVRMAAGAFVVNLVLSLALMGPLGVRGLALASNIAIVLQTMVLQWVLGRREPRLAAGRQWRCFIGVAGVSAVMAVCVAAGWWGLRELEISAWMRNLAAVIFLVPLGVAVYFGLALALRLPGLDELKALIAAKTGRRVAAEADE